MCYHLWGEDARHQQHCIRFYRFMAQFILDGLLSKWGKQYELMHKGEGEEDGQKVTLYDQLPKQFSRDQLRELIIKLDLSTPERIFINKWKRTKMVFQPDASAEVYIKNY